MGDKPLYKTKKDKRIKITTPTYPKHLEKKPYDDPRVKFQKIYDNQLNPPKTKQKGKYKSNIKIHKQLPLPE